MSKWLLGLCGILVGGAMILGDAEAARRLGGGGSSGAQRSMTNTPPAQKAAPAQQNQQKAAPAQQQPSRWAGILGGLALGGMLGYLLGGSGLGGAILGMLLLAALVFGAVMLFRALAQRREAPQPVQFAGTGLTERALPPREASQGTLSSAPSALPAGFDGAGFLKGAKMNFIRLQAANDAGRIEDIREFTTDEMFGALKRDVDERGGATQRTDVVSLDAQLVEVVTEGDRHWASVRFCGTIREDAGAAEGFEEVWNLVKPADGSSGWLLAGIQQMH
jgi:predicted lipid-binding transport protein (Tim44 family)